MAFEVRLSRRAREDIAEWASIIAADNLGAAFAWLQRMRREIDSLAEMPRRFGPARERGAGDRELRQFVVGRRGRTHRILFEVRDDPAEVRVYAVLASTQNDPTAVGDRGRGVLRRVGRTVD